MRRGSGKRLALLLSVIALASTLPAEAVSPAFAWGAAFSGTETGYANDVGVDPAGNVYSTGWFAFDSDFDPGPGTFTIDAQCCATYVSKLSPAGEFVWAVSLGEQPPLPPQPICVGPAGCIPYVTEHEYQGICVGNPEFYICPGVALETFSYVEAFDLDVDQAGNVYVAGDFQGTVDFDPGPGVYELKAPTGLGAFVLKLDPLGRFVWARAWGDGARAAVEDIAVDDSGNVYTGGSFSETVDFDPGPARFLLVALPAASDAWVSKLDASGNFVWARSVMGAGYDRVESLDVGQVGNVVATGYFELVSDFDPEPLAVDPMIAPWNVVDAAVDAFVWKLDSAGAEVWARRLGGDGLDVGYDVAVDGEDNVHTSGVFCGETADFDPGSGSAILERAGDNCNVFVSKLDAAGDHIWAGGVGGGPLSPNGLAVTDDGRVLVGGDLHGTVDFDPGPGSFQLTGTGDGFLAEMAGTGGLVWAGLIESTTGFSSVSGVAVDEVGGSYATGSFSGNADLDPGAGTFEVTTPPSQYISPPNDPYVVKLAAPA